MTATVNQIALDFSLHYKQGLAYETIATEVCFGGGAGGGKSHLLRIASILWCFEIPGLQVYFFRRTFPDLWKNHMDGVSSFPALLAEWVKDGLAKINYSKNVIEFWNNAKIHLCHCQYEKDVFNYQGAEIHVLIIDELTHFTKKIYEFLRSRVRLGGLKIAAKLKGLFPRILCGTNPGGIGHNWVKADFVDFAPPLEMKRAKKEDGGMLRQFIPSLLEDNPTLMENDPDYSDRLEGLGNPALVKAMRTGDWNIVAGGMFDDVWDSSIHVIPPFTIPATWRLDRSFDWGSSKPYSVGFWAESDGSDIVLADGTKKSTQRGSLYLIAELYGWNGKPNEGTKELAVEVARKIKAFEQSYGRIFQAGVADTSIFNTDNGQCIADDMARIGIGWTRADKSPGSRINGWEIMRKRLKAAITGEGAGLYVFNTCRQFIRTVPVLPRDENKTDDVDSDAEDHIADAVRYRCSAFTAKLNNKQIITTTTGR
jgi:hypothetical protein